MAQIEVTGKDALDWIFKLMSLAIIPTLGWAWNLHTDVKLAQQKFEQHETAAVAKFTEMHDDYEKQLGDQKSDYEKQLHAQQVAHNKEIQSIKADLQKVDTIGKRAEDNALTLAKIEVKMDATGEKIDEIKKLLANGR